MLTMKRVSDYASFSLLAYKDVRQKSRGTGSAITLIGSTNSSQFIAFLMESKLNIVLHDAPTPCIAVGEL